MGIAEGGMMTVRAGLYERIEALEAGIEGMSDWEIAEQVDAVRHIAHHHGLRALEEMAHGCVSMLAWSPGRTAIKPWLEALHEALGCEALDPGAARVWLAALGQRMAH